jgi:UDP-2,4-diacetamido-2,4,6-trideoxy-beta-L-altropyranose hydrolase
MRLWIRSDANAEMGTGHVMRCLALGQAWCDAGGEVTFSTACSNSALLARLRQDGFEVLPRQDAETWPASKDGAAWLVLDGYHFGAEHQLCARQAGYKVLVIDDMAGLPHYWADVVLNQNFGAERRNYQHEIYTRLLLGCSYALLRRDFLPWRSWRRNIPVVARKVLVTLGGSDPSNASLAVLNALKDIPIADLELFVLAGAANEHSDALRAFVEASPIQATYRKDSADMPTLLAWADFAVLAGGTTVWEAASMGLPMAVVITADNQKVVAEGASEAGCAWNTGLYSGALQRDFTATLWQLLESQQMREAMSHRGRRLVDAGGAARVTAALRRISSTAVI